jgi:hypothetical protein
MHQSIRRYALPALGAAGRSGSRLHSFSAFVAHHVTLPSCAVETTSTRCNHNMCFQTALVTLANYEWHSQDRDLLLRHRQIASTEQLGLIVALSSCRDRSFSLVHAAILTHCIESLATKKANHAIIDSHIVGALMTYDLVETLPSGQAFWYWRLADNVAPPRPSVVAYSSRSATEQRQVWLLIENITMA